MKRLDISNMYKIYLIAFIMLLIGCHRNYNLYIILDDATGIESGSSVKYNGVDVGKVINIYIKNYDVIAKLEIETTFKIPVNSQFSIVKTDILGNKEINISPIEQNGKYYLDKDTVYNIVEGSPNFMDSTINNINSTINEIKDSILNTQH